MHWRMAKRIWKCLFNLKTPWKATENTLIFEVKVFQSFFRHFSWHNFHEKCTKNTWKMPENPWFKNQGVFRGFSNPPFCAPTLCHSRNAGPQHATTFAVLGFARDESLTCLTPGHAPQRLSALWEKFLLISVPRLVHSLVNLKVVTLGLVNWVCSKRCCQSLPSDWLPRLMLIVKEFQSLFPEWLGSWKKVSHPERSPEIWQDISWGIWDNKNVSVRCMSFQKCFALRKILGFKGKIATSKKSLFRPPFRRRPCGEDSFRLHLNIWPKRISWANTQQTFRGWVASASMWMCKGTAGSWCVCSRRLFCLV